MTNSAKTVDEYLKSIPEDRYDDVIKTLQLLRDSVNEGFEEGIQYGMIGYYVPHSLYPAGYHTNPKESLPFIGLANQKNHLSLYLMCIYADTGEDENFREEWVKTGKKLDMGKSCIRFKNYEELAADVLAKTIKSFTVKDYISLYESVRPK